MHSRLTYLQAVDVHISVVFHLVVVLLGRLYNVSSAAR